MKKLLLASAALLALPVAANAQIAVETTNFITAPTQFNGFEAIASDPNYHSRGNAFRGGATYTEDGISVSYVGGDNSSNEIFVGYLREGRYGWYNNGGGVGYTRITRADGSDFSAVQFLAGSGFGSAGYGLQYNLLNNGVSVATGVAGTVGHPLRYYGFSGGGFDEIWLQNNLEGAFRVGSYEALALDSIALGGSNGVPEPAAWAMMLAGFGLVGSAMRRREKLAVTYA